MKLIRMFTGPDERSHLEELPLGLGRDSDTVESAVLRALGGRANIRVSTGTMPDLHPAPRNQYLVVLEGDVDVIMGDGQQMAVGPGRRDPGGGHVRRGAHPALPRRLRALHLPLRAHSRLEEGKGQA